VNTCNSGVISLRKISKETVPPRDTMEMYRIMIIERYGVLGALEFIGKARLGKKI
jgi:hypothetical protein